MNIKQKIFADEYLKHGDKITAYQKAYPKCTRESASAKSSDLLKKVKDYITTVSELVNKKVEEKLTEQLANKQLENLLTAVEKREILAGIARGTAKITKTVLKDGFPVDITKVPNYQSIIRAIDIENRMTGDEAPKKYARTDTIGKTLEEKENQLIIKLELGKSIL